MLFTYLLLLNRNLFYVTVLVYSILGFLEKTDNFVTQVTSCIHVRMDQVSLLFALPIKGIMVQKKGQCSFFPLLEEKTTPRQGL